MRNDGREAFLDAVLRLGVSLDPAQEALLWQFWELLAFWNRKINLVSVNTADDFFLTHILDTLALVPFLPISVHSLIDLGSGAGLPGIPLQIVRPDMEVTLLEASRRRSSFLREVIRQLHLPNTTVINDRVEHVLNEANHRRYDCVTSRATWPLDRLLILGAPFLYPRGTLITLKGDITINEQHRARLVLPHTGLSLRHDVTVPTREGGHIRRVIVFEKNF